MTTRTHKHTIRGRATILAALGVTSLALIAASPASAIYRDYEAGSDEPVITRTASQDDTAKKGCTLAVLGPDGKTQSTITYAHGYSFSAVNKATGKTHTYTCNNGTWVETVSSVGPGSGYTYDADKSYVQADGSAVLVNPHQQYTYSTSDGYYAAP
jgi:hypothetical protein